MLARQFGQQMRKQRIESLPALTGQQEAAGTPMLQLSVEGVKQIAAKLQRIIIARMQLQPAGAEPEYRLTLLG